jgi:hypothetical protein
VRASHVGGRSRKRTDVGVAARSTGKPVRRCSSRSGGNRTLTTPGKSRVRFQLRYGPARHDSIIRPPDGDRERRVVEQWDARDSNPHLSG